MAGAVSTGAGVGLLFGWMGIILENLAEAVTVADSRGNILLRNRTARELMMLDGPPGEGEPTECQIKLRTRDGAEVPMANYPLAKLIRGETVQREEYMIERRDGSTRIAQFSGTVISDNQKPYIAVLTYTDVTDIRRYQDAQQDYVRAVSHDIHNPLAALLAQAQLLEMETRQSGMAQVNKAAQVILSNGRRINTMLDGLVESFRLDAGLGNLSPEKVDLRALVSEVTGRYRAISGDDRLALSLPEDPCWAIVDPDKVERAIENLISNAFQYSPPGSPVTVSLASNDGYAAIRVSDLGSGIGSEHLPRVFDRFYRADYRNTRGLGLGLYTVKVTAEAHGGTVTVQSQVGKGSTFTVSLPLA